MLLGSLPLIVSARCAEEHPADHREHQGRDDRRQKNDDVSRSFPRICDERSHGCIVEWPLPDPRERGHVEQLPVTVVIDLERRVLDLESLPEHRLKLLPDRVTVILPVHEHVRRERREA